MSLLEKNINNLPWSDISNAMHKDGFAIVRDILPAAQCRHMIDAWSDSEIYRKTVSMERFRFGKGTYKYFTYPLPDPVKELRRSLYPHLAPIANTWMQQLGIDRQFGTDLSDLLTACQDAGQAKPTPLILRYETGDYNCLHQDLYGDIYFPIQAAILLNQPGEDFEGGEFVLTQQNPRAQSKASVLTPNQGDMILFTTNFRPVAGKRGYYRAMMKHGVSEIRQGTRHCLGIIFHDATH